MQPKAEKLPLSEELALKSGLLDLAPDGLYITDSDGNIIYANEAACQSRGCRREELLGLNLRDLFTAKAAQEFPKTLAELFSQGEIGFETTMIRPEGGERFLKVRAKLIDLPGRRFFLAIAHDSTERREAREIKTWMEVQPHRGEKLEAWGSFVNGIAHEFNNVLGAIKGNLELCMIALKRTPKGDDLKGRLEAARRSGDRASELLKQMLACSRRSQQEAPPPEVYLGEAGSPGKEHILLVDDEASLLQISREYLQRLGYRVTVSANSVEAWAIFQSHPEEFDLVITDLSMSQLNGIDLAEAMLGLRSDLPIILTSGYSDTNILEEARGKRIRQCLSKPLILSRLGRIVRRELDRKT